VTTAPDARIRQAFVGFHVILGLALLWGSIHTILHLGPGDVHATIVGGIEALGAIAFLLPSTLRLGAALLLVSVVGAMLLHALRGEPRPDLLVYAAGVLLVAVHGSAYRNLQLKEQADG
jgi:uncharacterized membrane protein YphA (DoxX/SURF4 family)